MFGSWLLLAALALQPVGGDAELGFAERTLSHGGRTRIWAELIPPECARPAARCMVVVMLHGGRGAVRRGAQAAERGPERLPERIGLADAARRERFVLLTPAAAAGNWNDGRPEVAGGIDDVGFLRAMLDDAGRRAPIAPSRTVVAGISNGGLMAFRLACDAPDRLRAIGAVVANMGATLSQGCPRSRPVDVMQVLGGQDPLMPYEGRLRSPRGAMLSAANSLRFWGERLTRPVYAEPRMSGDATLRTVVGRDGRVEQWTLASYGHGWPGAADPLAGGRLRGDNPSGFDATRRLLDFFRRSIRF